jgi:hypothetical protein
MTFVAGFGTAFSTGLLFFSICRLLVGIGLGGNLSVDFVLFLEYVPVRRRGQMMMMMTMFGVLGVFVIALAARALIPTFGWRYYVAVCSLPSFLLLLVRLRSKFQLSQEEFTLLYCSSDYKIDDLALAAAAAACSAVPESPRHLWVNGKVYEAERVLRYMAHINENIGGCCGGYCRWGASSYSAVGAAAAGAEGDVTDEDNDDSGGAGENGGVSIGFERVAVLSGDDGDASGGKALRHRFRILPPPLQDPQGGTRGGGGCAWCQNMKAIVRDPRLSRTTCCLAVSALFRRMQYLCTFLASLC